MQINSIFSNSQYNPNITMPTVASTFATNIQDAMTRNSLTYRQMLFNEFYRPKTLEETESLRKFYSDSWKATQVDQDTALGRFFEGWAVASDRMAADKAANKIRELKATPDYSKEELAGLERELEIAEYKLNRRIGEIAPEKSDMWSAYNLGQGLRSMRDALLVDLGIGLAETATTTAIAGAATGGAGAAPAALTSGTINLIKTGARITRTASRLAKLGVLYDMFKDQEAGSLYRSLYNRDDLTEEQKQAAALSYGRLAGGVELLGWNLGVGGLLSKGAKAAVSVTSRSVPAIERWAAKAELTQTLKETAINEAKKTILPSTVKGAAKFASAVSAEVMEEGVQRAMEMAALEKTMSGQTVNELDVLGGGFYKFAQVPVQLVQGKLSDESISILEAMGAALLPSIVAGGAGMAMMSLASREANNKVPQNLGKQSDLENNISTIKKAITSAETSYKRVNALVEFMKNPKAGSSEFKLQFLNKMQENGELEKSMFIDVNDIETIIAMAASSNSTALENLATRLGIAKAIETGRKTGIVEIPTSSLAELVALPESEESGINEQISLSATMSSDQISYNALDRKIKEKAGKETETEDPIFTRAIKGLRQQFKRAGFADPEIEANVFIFQRAVKAIAQASNGRYTVADILNDFKIDIEKREFDINTSDLQKAIDKIVGDKRRVLGYFTRKLVDPITSPKKIKINKHADITTFAHEVMHFVTESLIDMYNKGQLSSVWKKEVDTLIKFYKIRKDKNGGYKLTKKPSEQLSAGFQLYLESGKAKNPTLEKLFAWIKTLATALFQALTRGYFRDSPVEGVPEQFYGMIFDAHSDIINTEYEYGYSPIDQMDGVTDEEYQQYILEKMVARARSSDDLFKAQRELVKARLSEAWKQKYNEAYNNALEELGQEVRYQIIEDIVNAGGINKESLERFIKDPVSERYIAEKGGITVEQLISKYGEQLTPEVLRDYMNTTLPLKEAAENVAKNEADSELMNENNPINDAAPANALRNMLFIKTLLKEAFMIKGKGLSGFNAYYNQWIEAAEDVIQNMSLRNLLDIAKWADFESRITDDFITALTNGKIDVASIKAEQRAMVNYIFLRAKAIAKERNMFIKKFSKFYRNSNSSDLKKMDGITWNLIHEILRAYGFTSRKGRIPRPVTELYNMWIEEREGNQFFPAEMFRNLSHLLVNPDQGSSISIRNFESLFLMLESIKEVGEREKIVLDNERKNKFDVIIGEAVTNITNMRSGGRKNLLEKYSKRGWGRIADSPIGLLEPLFGKMGMRELYVNLRNALVARDNLEETVRKTIADSYVRNKIAKYMKDKSVFKIGKYDVTYDIMLFALQHSGNTHNKENAIVTLQQYFKDETFGEADYMAILNASPKELRNYTNDLWAMFKMVKALIDEQSRVASGRLIGTVEAQPYTLDDGTEMTGGYFPATKMDRISAAEDLDAYLNPNLFFPMPGFTKDRIANKLGFLDMSQEALNRWVFQAINLATMQVAFNDIQHVIQDKNLQDALGQDRDAVISYLKDWLKTTILPQTPLPTGLRALNKFPTAIYMGFKAVSGFVQLLGVIPAITEISPVQLSKSATKILSIPKYLRIESEMKKRGAFMADRAKRFDSSYFGIMQNETDFQKARRKYGDAYMTVAMTFVRTFQGMTDIIVFDAAKAEALSKGLSEADAQKHAEYMVMKTQGDKSAINTPSGFAGVAKFFQPFMSYILTLRQIGTSYTMTRNYKKVGLLVATVVLSSIIEAYIKEYDKDWRRKYLDKDTKGSDSDFNKRATNRAVANIVSTLGGVAMPFLSIGATVASTVTEDLFKESLGLEGYRAYTTGAPAAIETLKTALKTIMLDEKALKKVYDEDMDLWANLIDFVI